MKILLIEDDVFFQKFYSAKLVEAGFEVATAIDGDDGLAKMLSVKPNLILLDMIMPNKDGFEVLQNMSQNVELKKIPVIIFSTLGDENDVKRAMQLGAADYINKSFHDIENLKTKINAQLSGGTVQTSAVQQETSSVQVPPVQMPPIQPPQQTTQPVKPVEVTQPQSQPPVPPQGTPQKDGNTTGRT